ncbi:hypothetical protein [Streptomyces sp. NBC_01763]|uniref:hypothetical protein n=1 Tax=Streptomyces sp. NBC_01763 TaxID=2975934 RepID=UPI002DDAB470|nr:hypothetical protein [Streptomyces sp. NBC_01763]WSC35658.1 hypothetical protein OHA08_09175 [Streptomyces sp. NBC_01763]
MTTQTLPDHRLARDAELRRLLAVVVDTARDESPFGWSEPQPVCPQDTATRCRQ